MDQELRNDLIAAKWEIDNSLDQLEINDNRTLGILFERLGNAKMWLDKHIPDDAEIEELN